VIAGHGLPVQLACRVLNVSESGYYARRSRAPSARAIRHVWLTDVIRQVHIASRGTYGIRRVHADLILGQGIAVGHLAVEMLMRRAGIRGISGRPRFRHIPGMATAGDRVDRQFHRDQPNQLWVTDITEHPTRQFTSWAFTRPAVDSGLLPSMGSVGDCFDNAMIESFWSRMQVEVLDRTRWSTRIELASAIFEYLEIFHNRQRRHSSLSMLTPLEFEARHQPTTAA